MPQMPNRADLAAQIALKNRAELTVLAKKLAEIAAIQPEKGEKGESGKDGCDGKDAPPVTDEQIKSAAVAWLSANIHQPADGKDGLDGENGVDGKDARDPTSEEIQLAVDLWFELNKESLKGEQGERGEKGKDGKNGRDGQTPEHEWQGTMLRFRRASGIWGPWVDLQGPAGASGGGGGGTRVVSSGVTEVRQGDGISIDNTDPKRPIISATGGGGSQQQVFLGAPEPLPNYPALIFDAVTIDGQTSYAMRFNDGLA